MCSEGKRLLFKKKRIKPDAWANDGESEGEVKNQAVKKVKMLTSSCELWIGM